MRQPKEINVATHHSLGVILFFELKAGWWYAAKPKARPALVKYRCPKCDGTGRVQVFREPTDRCYRCDGAKFLWMTKKAWDQRKARLKATAGVQGGSDAKSR